MFQDPQQGDTLPKHLIKYNIPTLSPEWFEFRTVGNKEYEGGIGASETGILCGVNEYQSALELYGNKVGSHPTSTIDNLATFQGRMMENYVLMLWEHTDEREDSHVLNHHDWERKGKKDGDLIRKAYHEKAYVVNPKYPWLFISLDGWSAPGTHKVHTGEIVESGFPIEAKTIAFFSAKQYENGYPRSYVYQIHQQMLVTEATYGEIAILEDGRKFRIYGFDRDEKIIQEIIDKTKYFWYNRVLPARQAFKLQKKFEVLGNTQRVEQAMSFIQRLEPDVQSGDKYLEAKLDRYREKEESVDGSREAFGFATSYKNVSDKIKDLTVEKKLHRNQLVAEMVNNGAKILDFGDNGQVKLSAANRLNVKVKEHDRIRKSKSYLWEYKAKRFIHT